MKKIICMILAAAFFLTIPVVALAVESHTPKAIPDDVFTAVQELSALWPNSSYPDDVGGLVMNNEQDKLVILLVNNTAARQAEVRRLVSRPAALQFASCKYSFQQLRAAQEDIITRYGLGEQSGIVGIGIGWSCERLRQSLAPGFGISGFENRVVVSVATERAYNKLQKEFAARSGDMVYVERESAGPGYIPKTDSDVIADAVFDPPKRAVATGRANVRTGCGKSHKKIGRLKNGQEIEVLLLSGEWAEIAWEDGTAFVHTDYIRFIDAQSTDGTTPAQTLSATATSRVNVRFGPGKGYRKLGQLKKGDTVLISAIEGNWARIEWKNGESAYVYADYLHIAP